MRTFLIALCLFTLTPPGAAQDVIRIVGQEGDERFYPLIQSIYRSMGLEAEFTVQPSARALASVNNGTYDAEVGRIPDILDEYPNIVYSNEPLLTVQLVGIVKKSSGITFGSAEDLGKYRVGYLLGMSVAETYVAETGLEATSAATHQQLARLLTSGRIDIVIMGTAFKDSAVYVVGKEAISIKEYNVYHIFNRSHANLVQAFDENLVKAKNDGRYDTLLTSTYE